MSLGIEARLASLPSPSWIYGPNRPDLRSTGSAGLGILAERLRARVVLALAAAGWREAAGVFALGIVGAGDERAELAAAQRQPPVAAIRAEPRIAAVGLVGEQIGREELVERGGDLATASAPSPRRSSA